MAELWKGAPATAALGEELRAKVKTLNEKGVVPKLAILRVGEREDDLAYERGAKKRCESVGVAVEIIALPADASQEEILQAVHEINEDESIHGCLMFRPLPRKEDEEKACALLKPEKDVDGMTPGSLASVFAGKGAGYPPCTAKACMEMLKYYGVSPEGKRAVVIGRSLVIGRPVSMMLQSANATVTMCHTRTVDLPSICREADILVVAAGRAGVVGAECMNPGQVVIDVGIHVNADGQMCGDVRLDEAMNACRAITPVPGGVGTMTSSVLAAHVIDAAERKAAPALRSAIEGKSGRA